jgi:hypothetical protein
MMPQPSLRSVPFLLLLALFLGGCDAPDAPPARDAAGEPGGGAALEAAHADEGDRALAPEQQAFWATLTALCGQAFEGELRDATAHYAPGVEGREARIHVMDCQEDRIHVPFHLDDDRSRNWILTRERGTLHLSHDHRNADGSEEEISRYGGPAPVPGLATRQIFQADGHTARILPDRADNFWFLDFVEPGALEYGVHWPRYGHSIRFRFDLTRPIAPLPRPWGYEEGEVQEAPGDAVVPGG